MDFEFRVIADDNSKLTIEVRDGETWELTAEFAPKHGGWSLPQNMLKGARATKPLPAGATLAAREALRSISDLLEERGDHSATSLAPSVHKRPPPVQELATRRGIETQKELVRVSGLSRATVGKVWTRGCSERMSSRLLCLLGEALGVSVDTLLGLA